MSQRRGEQKCLCYGQKQSLFFGRPANSLVTSPTYLLQKLEVPLPCSHTVTSGTTASSVYITTQGPLIFLSRGYLEPLQRVQSCWCMKPTFHFQLYTSLRIYGVLPPFVRKHLFCGSQAQGQVYVFLPFIIYIYFSFHTSFLYFFFFLFVTVCSFPLLFCFFLFSCICSFFNYFYMSCLEHKFSLGSALTTPCT